MNSLQRFRTTKYDKPRVYRISRAGNAQAAFFWLLVVLVILVYVASISLAPATGGASLGLMAAVKLCVATLLSSPLLTALTVVSVSCLMWNSYHAIMGYVVYREEISEIDAAVDSIISNPNLTDTEKDAAIKEITGTQSDGSKTKPVGTLPSLTKPGTPFPSTPFPPSNPGDISDSLISGLWWLKWAMIGGAGLFLYSKLRKDEYASDS